MSHIGIRPGGVYLDGTFGLGGHAAALLRLDGSVKVIGLDRDPCVLERAYQLNAELLEYRRLGRLRTVNGRLSQMLGLFSEHVGKLDGILMDLGVCSVQIDTASRGFSYRKSLDAPLDMRMNQSEQIPTAADIVNKFTERDLADLIYRYGEERRSFSIAKRIVDQRREKPIESTWELAQIVDRAYPRAKGRASAAERIADRVKRTFQAIRIQVNDELEELKKALFSAERLLRPGGVLIVITFHSLEDGIVKGFFNRASGRPAESELSPEVQNVLSQVEGPVRLVRTFDNIQKITKVSKEEASENKRARSAKLRVGVRTSHPSATILTHCENSKAPLARKGVTFPFF
ncbi:ribosomal RNA small subunit methyltransferase H-like [Schistocerca gregaria]|uniref:ribosomal RNA small subunit methyltransferase H-like n=1 Tax=Schistocerca gregaria TaxID=7010 RepID=UPI00211F21E6|nr:ribosomal RNA small subunit methyltransferase H-like [Schistocerca gregaria]